MDRLFFDTNVLLDVLEKRAPWFPESVECLARARGGDCTGAISGLTLSDIAYIQRATPVSVLYDSFRRLREFLEIANLEGTCIDDALHRRLPDVEDGFQLSAALQWGASHLITRNVKDFPRIPGLEILSPQAYLRNR